MKIKKISLKKQNSLEDVIFLSPWILGTIMFFVYPVFYTFKLSVSELISFEKMAMVYDGFYRFRELTVDNKENMKQFFEFMYNIFLKTPFIICFSLLFAVVLNREFKGRFIYRMIMVLPLVLGSGIIMQQILGIGADEQINQQMNFSCYIPYYISRMIGSNIIEYLSAFIENLNVILWNTCVQTIIFLGALQSIPVSLFESAYCDGATEWEMFWKIKFPYITKYITINLVFTIIVLAMNVDNKIILRIIDTSRIYSQKQYSDIAVLSCIVIAIVLVFSIVSMLMSKLWEKDVEM